MASKLPDSSLFDSPLRATSSPPPKPKPVKAPTKNSKKPAQKLAAANDDVKPKRKLTVYISDDQWDALNEEVYLLRKSGLSAKAANITKVTSVAIDEWVSRRKTSK